MQDSDAPRMDCQPRPGVDPQTPQTAFTTEFIDGFLRESLRAGARVDDRYLLLGFENGAGHRWADAVPQSGAGFPELSNVTNERPIMEGWMAKSLLSEDVCVLCNVRSPGGP